MRMIFPPKGLGNLLATRLVSKRVVREVLTAIDRRDRSRRAPPRRRPGIVSADLSCTQYRSSGLFLSLDGLYEEILAELIHSGFRPHRGQQR
jgi:hypothetical protein